MFVNARQWWARCGAGLTVAALLSACQPAAWTRVDAGAITVKPVAGQVEAPAGWIRYAAYADGLILTRDGTPIQYIKVVKAAHETAFKGIGRKSSPDLLPNELAELLIAARKATPAMKTLEVKGNEPASFGDQEGVKLHFSYRDARGAAFEQMVYASVTDSGVLLLEYQALSRYFFARDLDIFEKLAASFRDRSVRPPK